MSLILEALRKSEAERRRGQAPGLFVEQIPVAAARRPRTPAWAWMLVALLLGVLVLLAWREFGRGMADADVPAAVEVREPAPPAPPAPPAITEPSRDHPTNASPSDPVASTPAILPTPAETTASVPGAVTSPTEAPRTTTPASAPASATAPAPAQTTVAASPAGDPAATVVAPVPAAIPEDAVPRLASLPASDRAQLPPLKLSMHVYAEDPAQRFVILDGKRLQEGASPAAGVVLEQIRRDGLVLSVNGRRVLLARP